MISAIHSMLILSSDKSQEKKIWNHLGSGRKNNRILIKEHVWNLSKNEILLIEEYALKLFYSYIKYYRF